MCFMTWWNFRILPNLIKGSKEHKQYLFNRYLHKAYSVPGLRTFTNINSLNPCKNEVDSITCDILQRKTEA